mmetsp:Transcript_34371/g.102700  ORF Transcript_34371/g.102700 Transcript_34371/m.102700 type:complete len:316 (-) Transcript_34371:236-1183(-)
MQQHCGKQLWSIPAHRREFALYPHDRQRSREHRPAERLRPRLGRQRPERHAVQHVPEGLWRVPRRRRGVRRRVELLQEGESPVLRRLQEPARPPAPCARLPAEHQHGHHQAEQEGGQRPHRLRRRPEVARRALRRDPLQLHILLRRAPAHVGGAAGAPLGPRSAGRGRGGAARPAGPRLAGAGQLRPQARRRPAARAGGGGGVLPRGGAGGERPGLRRYGGSLGSGCRRRRWRQHRPLGLRRAGLLRHRPLRLHLQGGSPLAGLGCGPALEPADAPGGPPATAVRAPRELRAPAGARTESLSERAVPGAIIALAS